MTTDHKHIIAEIPEIVDQIIWHLSAYQDPTIAQASILHYNKKHLHPCLFVNRLWYSCAVRHIWRHVIFEDSVHDSYAFQKFASIFSNTQMALPKPLPSSSFSSTLFSFLSTDCTDFKFPLPTPPILSSSSFCKQKDFIIARRTKSSPSLSVPAPTAPPSTQLPPLPNHPTRLSTPLLSIYNEAIRSLTIRKLKDRSLNSMLIGIAQYATKLTNIDFYICDHLSNDALMSLFRYACPSLTHVSLAGCYRISDESIIMLAHYVPGLIYLDLRACGSISDVSITAIAMSCPNLKHLNVGRIRERDRITSQSIIKIAECTQVTVLGLAGCAIDDQAIIQLATYRHHTLERVSVNNCQRLTNKSLRYLFNHCPNLTVFEMKDCHYITDWYIVHDLLTRNVILTLSEQQSKEYREWCDLQPKKLIPSTKK
ncbi:unnamed protein product [Cunninghamella echinulata]